MYFASICEMKCHYFLRMFKDNENSSPQYLKPNKNSSKTPISSRPTKNNPSSNYLSFCSLCLLKSIFPFTACVFSKAYREPILVISLILGYDDDEDSVGDDEVGHDGIYFWLIQIKNTL